MPVEGQRPGVAVEEALHTGGQRVQGKAHLRERTGHGRPECPLLLPLRRGGPQPQVVHLAVRPLESLRDKRSAQRTFQERLPNRCAPNFFATSRLIFSAKLIFKG